MTIQENNVQRKRPIRKFLGYTALAVAATPVVFGLYVFGRAATYAFKHPTKTVLGTIAATSIMYGVHKGIPQDLYQKITQPTTVSQTSNTCSALEEHIQVLEQENHAFRQDPYRPIILEQKRYDPLFLASLGIGVFGLGVAAGYNARKYLQSNNQRYAPTRTNTHSSIRQLSSR